MRSSIAPWIAALMTAAAAGVALWVQLTLPAGAGLPTQYLGLDGVRHGQAPREVLWVIPFAAAIVTGALTFGPRRRAGAEAAALPLDMTLIAVPGVLLVAEAAMAGRAFDPAFNVMGPVAIATGVLLVAIGNYLGKARQNAIFGLRTPWTLADATVWDRTHRFTGLGMVLGGLALIALGFLLHDSDALGVSIAACAAIPPLAGIVRSAALHRGLQRG